MHKPNTTKWMLTGLLALPVYGLLTAWSSLEPQPDQVTDTEGWARFVSTDAYLLSHLIGSTGGTILAIFGVFALGCYLAQSRAGRMGLSAMVVAALGHALLLVPAVLSTFVTPAIGQAYLAGFTDVMQVEFSSAMELSFLLGLLLAFAGSVLLGVAVWRSRILAKWAGAAWIAATMMFYVFGVVMGQATTGSSLPTQAIGALLIAISGGWIAWSAFRASRTDSVDRMSRSVAH